MDQSSRINCLATSVQARCCTDWILIAVETQKLILCSFHNTLRHQAWTSVCSQLLQSKWRCPPYKLQRKTFINFHDKDCLIYIEDCTCREAFSTFLPWNFWIMRAKFKALFKAYTSQQPGQRALFLTRSSRIYTASVCMQFFSIINPGCTHMTWSEVYSTMP